VPIIDPQLLHGIHVMRMRRAGALKPDHHHDAIFQASTLDALLDGAYEGDLSFGELARHGDFGLGTLQGLDGEMIALDGRFFVARVDGRVSPVAPETKTPFAVVVPWEADGSCALGAIASMDELCAAVDLAIGHKTEIMAVRVDGHFTRVKARSVAKQSPPYPPLVDVTAHQTVFEWSDLDGTLVGFRFPDAARGYEMVGYHFHFLSTDRLRGGHLLDCAMPGGTVQYHRTRDLHVEIPKGLAWHAPETSAAKEAVLKRAER
jgi:acetolactate decarboxylase